MLDKITAVGFQGPVGTGRTRPCRLECERDTGEIVEVVAKCSAGTMEHEKNLTIEAIAAMLAADLGLPVPEPFLVELTPEFVDLLRPWPEVFEQMSTSCRFAFGTAHLPTGFAVWAKGQPVPPDLSVQAAEIFTFDGIIVNSDRRPGNPNCLYSGQELAIIDHELSFASDQVLFWREPWVEGGFDSYASPDVHIFAKPNLSICPENLDRFVGAWRALDRTRFEEYFDAIPIEWQQPATFRERLVGYLCDVQANIDEVVRGSLGVLQ